MNIREEIVARRRERIASEGHTLGASVPDRREAPLTLFGREPFVICEIKRKSPSRGPLDEIPDPAAQAGRYIAGGALSLSVLTEEDHFGGTLEDLIAIKKAYPGAAVLRKDFLLDEEDIDVSHRAGADAVLLIASVLGKERLAALHCRARGLGMEVLVEVHSPDEAVSLRALRPSLTGINARNLENFSIDLLHPPAVRALLDWPTRTVFESGITREEDARFAGELGFDGILVGEAAVRDPRAVPDLIRGFMKGRGNPARFWGEIVRRRAAVGGRPLVKICGLTNPDDALAAEDLGADILGFVFADSPRRADPAFVAGLPPARALRVGVVVPGPGARGLPRDVEDLLRRGFLDAVQIHGGQPGAAAVRPDFPAYEAVRPRDPEEAVRLVGGRRTPRILLDAFVPGLAGGTGSRISPEILAAAAKTGPLWIAGGISPDNVREILDNLRPELVDLSSGLEERPGKKDRELMKKFFKELRNAEYGALS